MNYKTILFNEFYESKKDSLNEFTFLFGNGFLKSHLETCVNSKFDFNEEEYNEILNNTLQKTQELLSKRHRQVNTFFIQTLYNKLEIIWRFNCYD